MTYSRTVAIDYAHKNIARFLDELKDFSSIPSISTDPNAKPDMFRAANWVAEHLRNLGMQNVRVMPTALHPVVYGEYLDAGDEAPVLLIYGHYDVQPAEPLDLWHSAAFDPTIRDDYIYGRGVTDMKGQVLATLNALEAILRTSNLPINVKVLVEGEEEIGSPSLVNFMNQHKEMLACDLALNPDSGILSAEQPSITYALRGLAYFEIRVYGPDHDLHSGTFGGSVHNPAQALCELIAGMHNPDGSVALPGFYDQVRPLSGEEREEMARLQMTDEWYLANTGAPALWGEQGYTTVERTGGRPTLEVNGLYSGFTGEGSKTVLPAWAMAKVSCRLVADQDPNEVHQQLLVYMKAKAPSSIRWEVGVMAGSRASLSQRDSKGVRALAKAMEAVWKKKPVFKREGGSVPVVNYFRNILGVESVNTGFSMSSDNMHSPNERLHLPTWSKGMDALIHFYYNLGEN